MSTGRDDLPHPDDVYFGRTNLDSLAAKVPEVAAMQLCVDRMDGECPVNCEDCSLNGTPELVTMASCIRPALTATADYVARLETERDGWRGDALRETRNRAFWKQRAEQAEAEVAQLRKDVEKLKRCIRVLEGLE